MKTYKTFLKEEVKVQRLGDSHKIYSNIPPEEFTKMFAPSMFVRFAGKAKVKEIVAHAKEAGKKLSAEVENGEIVEYGIDNFNS